MTSYEGSSRLVKELRVKFRDSHFSDTVNATLSIAQLDGEVPVTVINLQDEQKLCVEGILKFRSGYYTLERKQDEPSPSIWVEPVWQNGESGLRVTDIGFNESHEVTQ